MRRLLVAAVMMLAACSSGGSNSAPSSSSPPSTSPSQLVGTLTVVAPLANSSIAHSSDNTCGVRLDGSVTGFDDVAAVTVKDRAGKLLADGRMPVGALQLGAAASVQSCLFHFTLTMYERPADVALFEFVWSRAHITVSESVSADTVNAGNVSIQSTLS